MSVQEQEGFYFGFVDLTISDIYEHYPAFFQSYDLLITCLDSSSKVIEQKKWLEYLEVAGFAYRFAGSHVWIPSAQIEKLFKEGKTFFGFDEAYLLHGYPKGKKLPRRRYTTDGSNFIDKISVQFIQHMKQLEAIRFLADGCGLNFACESHSVAKKIQTIVKV